MAVAERNDDDAVYRIGAVELDVPRHQLRCRERPLHVQPRVFDTLHCLMAESPRAVSREALLRRVWGDTTVEDGSVTRAIRGARAALRSDAGLAEAIETVRGFGYRLAGEVVRIPRSQEDAPGPAAGERPAVATDRPFVGRAPTLARLAREVEAARSGERRTILILGEPGSGKTSLVRHFAPGGFEVGEGQSLEGFGATTPYLPLLEAIVNLVRGANAAVRPRLLEILRRAAPSWIGLLPTLFDEATPTPRPVVLQRDQLAGEMLLAIEWMARDVPIALVLEDLHWADPSTLGLLRSLAQRSVPARLLLVGTARTTELDRVERLQALRADLLRLDRACEVELEPLSRDAVREYADRVLQRLSPDTAPLPDAVIDWLHARTEGLPLFLVQLVDHLAARGLLSPPAGRSVSPADLEAAGLPSTLGQLLHQSLGRIDDEERSLLEAAGAAGFDFDLRLIEAATPLAAREVEQACDRLCARGWLHFRGFETWPDGSVGARVRFSHALHADALQMEIPATRRARLHRAIAERLASGHADDPAYAGRIAAHFEQAGDEREGVRHRVRAAVAAAARQALEEAVEHAEYALARLDRLPPEERDPAECDLHMSIALALAAGHGFADERVDDHFARACTLARRSGDTSREVAATWGLCACRQMRGELPAAREVAERLLALARKTEEPRTLQFALGALVIIAYFQGRFRDCVELFEAAREALRRDPVDAVPAHAIQDTEVTIGIYAALSHWHLGDPERGRRTIEAAVARARTLGHPFTEALAWAFRSIFHHRLGETEAQRAHAETGERFSAEAGIPLWQNVSRFMAICADPPSAEQLPRLRETLQAMAGSGGLGGTFFIGLLAERELLAGNLENARNLARVGLGMAERTTEDNNRPTLYLVAARAEQDPATRAELLTQAADWAERLGSVALAAQVDAFRDPAEATAG